MTINETTTRYASPLANLRDLGGIRVTGGVVRPGLAHRADDVAYIDEAGAQALVDGGLSLIIDLRSPEETARSGRGPLEAHAVDYLHLPFTDSVAAPGAGLASLMSGAVTDPEEGATIMGRWYGQLLERQAPRMIAGLEAIAGTRGGAVFHCAAGKDRTGVFAASLLTVLGAQGDDIVTDYARTNDVLTPLLARLQVMMAGLLRDMPALAQESADATADAGTASSADAATGATADSGADSGATPTLRPSALMSAAPTTMRTMLADLDERRGGIEAVLREAGLGDDLVGELRARLVVA